MTPTNYRYTGQLQQTSLGLDFYVSRFYDPSITHFVQPDSMIPNAGSAKSFDQYAYVLNNPIRYNDPTGHDAGCGGRDCSDVNTPLPQPPSRTSVYIPTFSNYLKFSQYDLPYNLFGYNGCAVAAAIQVSDQKMNNNIISQASQVNSNNKNIYDFDPKYGMTPSNAGKLYQNVFGSNKVKIDNNSNLNKVYDAMASGKRVVVDMRVGYDNKTKSYSFTKDPENSFSHFAEIAGIDFEKRKIIIDDTITNGVNNRELSFDEFSNLWLNPEVKANVPSDIPDNRRESVDFWAAVIEP